MKQQRKSVWANVISQQGFRGTYYIATASRNFTHYENWLIISKLLITKQFTQSFLIGMLKLVPSLKQDTANLSHGNKKLITVTSYGRYDVFIHRQRRLGCFCFVLFLLIFLLQQLVQSSKRENTEAPHFWPSWRKTAADSWFPLQRVSNVKGFPCSTTSWIQLLCAKYQKNETTEK